MWLWSVLAAALLALITLASGAVKACSDLLLGSLAIRTDLQVKLYNIVRLDLDSPHHMASAQRWS
jgi:hypothetical protein